MQLVAIAVYYAIQFYIMLIFVWALASWFPSWRYTGWFRVLNDFVWPYMSLFAKLPLRSAGLDLTPLVAIMVLWILQRIVIMSASGGTL